MGYSPAQVQAAIDGLKKKLGGGPSSALQQEFEAGLHPTLLSYDKVEQSELDLPILTRYLVGAASSLHQPANYYNIFSACRCANMVQFLDAALGSLTTQRVTGLDERVGRLRRETRRDAFDAVAFELITAAKYCTNQTVRTVEFLAETSTTKTPDFVTHIGRSEMFVECKKIDRTQTFTMTVRNAALDLLNPVLSVFHSRKISALADATFHRDPQQISSSELQQACEASLQEGVAIVTPAFTVAANHLPPHKTGDIMLFPSPQLWWHRYGYRIRSEWIGIVNQLYGRYCRRGDLPTSLQGGASTWIDDIGWDSAAKWKISSDDVLAKYRRFAFDGIFRGFEQIEGRGRNATLHVWLESDHYAGARKDAFVDLFNRIATGARHRFGWLVINETLFDVSPKGIFDFVEHAHLVRGPVAMTENPIVSTVFVSDDAIEGRGEFGVGAELPDID
jgi:hypothetical protein